MSFILYYNETEKNYMIKKYLDISSSIFSTIIKQANVSHGKQIQPWSSKKKKDLRARRL